MNYTNNSIYSKITTILTTFMTA